MSPYEILTDAFRGILDNCSYASTATEDSEMDK